MYPSTLPQVDSTTLGDRTPPVASTPSVPQTLTSTSLNRTTTPPVTGSSSRAPAPASTTTSDPDPVPVPSINPTPASALAPAPTPAAQDNSQSVPRTRNDLPPVPTLAMAPTDPPLRTVGVVTIAAISESPCWPIHLCLWSCWEPGCPKRSPGHPGPSLDVKSP
jgi:hypothetical protein